MSNHTVYLIDDDDSVRRSVGFMLKTSGHAIKPFESGDQFLSSVRNLERGCILLDIRMPGKDGLEVQAELNNRGVDSPVVMMTGRGDIDMAVKAMKAGAIDFIQKPFEKATMLDAIERAEERLDNSDRRHARRKEAQVLLNVLTSRERDVLEGLVKGHPNKTIGYDLGISPRTIEIHRANLMSKLDVYNLSDLLRIAFAAGVGEEDANKDEQ